MKIAHRYTAEQTADDLHDADGAFFFRRQTRYGIHWELARFSSGVPDQEAIGLIRREGYYRYRRVDGKHDYIPVKVVEPDSQMHILIENALLTHLGNAA
jgi:hypothetical protein